MRLWKSIMPVGLVIENNGAAVCEESIRLNLDRLAATSLPLYTLNGNQWSTPLVNVQRGISYIIGVISPLFSVNTKTFSSLAGTLKWEGGVLAPNGFIYGIPRNSTTVLKMGNDLQGGIDPSFPLNRHFNKL